MAAVAQRNPGTSGGKSPLSVIALQIVREALKPEASPQALARMAESDPGFALRVIAMVNSAAFGFSRKVSDVRQAVAFIGVRGLRTLGLSLAVSDMVPAGPEGQVLLGNSLRRAVACQLIARKLGEREVDEYFTAGLFLEVGLLAFARDDLHAAAEVARLPALDRIVFERSRRGRDHAEQGEELAKAFSLPADLVEAVGTHHEPAPPPSAVGRAAWAAERVAAIWEGGDVPVVQREALRALDTLGLSDEAAADVLTQVPILVSAAAASFERDVGEQKGHETLLVEVSRSLVEMNKSYEAMVSSLERLLAEKEELSQKLQAANAELGRLASTDALTGLANKRSLQDSLKRDLARAARDKTSLSVVMADVDHFKKVNDTYGHATGDVVLRAVGTALGRFLRAGDLAARYGGEEFVLILPGSNVIGARIAAERIRKALEEANIETPNGALHVTASFGAAAVSGPDCGTIDELMERADAALYAAKRAGRNRVVIADGAGAASAEAPATHST